MKTTSFLKKIITVVLIAVASIQLHAQESNVPVEKSHRIVFQMTTSDTLAHKALMKQLKNIKSVSPSTNIEVVCHGPGLTMMMKTKTTVLKDIQTSKETGVVFNTCEFSLKERNVDKREIIAESNFVKAGIIYIVEKVESGYVYIKSGF